MADTRPSADSRNLAEEEASIRMAEAAVAGKAADNLASVRRQQLVLVAEGGWSALAWEKPASWPDHLNPACRGRVVSRQPGRRPASDLNRCCCMLGSVASLIPFILWINFTVAMLLRQ